MDQIFHPYTEWEDYKNGMYSDKQVEHPLSMKINAKKMLTSPHLFEKTLKNVLEKWPISSDNMLSNKNMNRRAWLGCAACSYYYGIPENITKSVFSSLSEINQGKANKIADKIIKYYENKNKKIREVMGMEMLF